MLTRLATRSDRVSETRADDDGTAIDNAHVHRFAEHG